MIKRLITGAIGSVAIGIVSGSSVASASTVGEVLAANDYQIPENGK